MVLLWQGNGAGNAANQLSGAAGIFVDSIGNIYISDGTNGRVQKWAPGATYGTTVAGANGTGSAVNQLWSPQGLFVDANGYIYVADYGNDRCVRWTQQSDSTFTPLAAGTYTVSDTNGNGCGTSSNSITIQTCLIFNDTVWPGDANNDGIANLYDILSLGLAYGDTGTIRQGANNSWTAQYCPAWTDTFITGVNVNHADCNGDGVVNADDTLPIVLNYGMTHAKTGNQRTPGAAPLYLALTNAPVAAGDTAKFNILLGICEFPLITFMELHLA